MSSRQSSFYRTKRRDYVLPFLAAILVLVGSFRIVAFSDLSIVENVSKFQISFGFIALGYVLSWQFSRKMLWLMILVAAIARIAVLPISNGESVNRMLWDSRVMSVELNPYELAPNAPELEAYRNAEWEKLNDRDQVSHFMPARLWAYNAAWEIGDPQAWLKGLLITLDLVLCFVFAARFGIDRAVLYAWNPLVIYCVGGLGVDACLYLLPVVAGYLIWEFWIDQKGGVSVIKASGGIGSALGQMVCVSTLLVGIGVSMNLLLLPILLWIVWHVLKRSGLRAGLITGVFGLAPLTLSLMWASISLNIDLWKVLPPEFNTSAYGISMVPGIVSFLIPSAGAHGFWFLVLLSIASVWMIHHCESIERFASFYLIWALMLSTSIHPWSFMILAIVGVGGGNYTFRVGSLSAFAYFGAYRLVGDVGAWSMPWTLQLLIWIPILVVAIRFAVSNRSRDGFYVHSF